MVLGLVLAGALALGGVPGAGNRISDFHVQNSPELTQYLADTDAQTREHERQFQAQLGTSPTDHTSMRISNEVMNFMQKNALNGKVDVACGATMCRAFSKLNFSKAHSTTEKTMEDLQDIYLKFGSRSYFRMANHSMSFAADGIQVNQQGNGSQDVLLLSYWRRRS